MQWGGEGGEGGGGGVFVLLQPFRGLRLCDLHGRGKDQ